MTRDMTEAGEIDGQMEAAGRSTFGFAVWCYAVAAWILAAFILRAAPESVRAWAFAGAIVLSYALLCILPTLAMIGATRWIRRRGGVAQGIGDFLVVGVAALSQLLLASDFVIHGMFGFHINGFVLNLITTPEGMQSMGADPAALRIYLFVALGTIAVNAAIWWTVSRRATWNLGTRRLKWALVTLLILAVGERVTYGIAYNQAWPDVMAVASTVPGYQPFTFRSLAKRMGFEMQRRTNLDAPRSNAALIYPTQPLATTPPANPPNIVWFFCESLRADMLTEEIMPRTWAFAQESQRFTHHYSGGNGTRMGMFTAFYGMPGNYWFNFLRNRRPPILVDRLQELDYRLRFSTSAAFTYPEFDKTILAHVPANNLFPLSKGSGWVSDRHHVGQMKAWLKDDKSTSPFFLFHFFESPHARYYFPPESVIRRPYLEDLNYATVELKRDIGLIRNRYINSVHHLDSQLGEMIDAIRAKNHLENTIIVITGDHGEEFMENGRWGHNSQFTEPQLRVPLIVHMPGRGAGVSNHRTSHVDLVPSLMPMLGVTSPPEDYSTGEDLFSPASRLLTFSDWDRIAISDGTSKAIFPLNATAQMGSRVTTAEDAPVKDESAALRQLGGPMVRLKNMMSQFTRKH